VWERAGRVRGRPAGTAPLASVLTEEFLRREYLGRGRSTVELAATLGCSPKSVLRYLAAHRIPVRTRWERSRPVLDREWLHDRYVEDGMTLRQIATTAGCSPRAVRGLLDEWSIERAPGPGLSDASVRKAYLAWGCSTTQIAARYGCSPSTVARHLRRLGVPLRPRGGRGRARVTDDGGQARPPACRYER